MVDTVIHIANICHPVTIHEESEAYLAGTSNTVNFLVTNNTFDDIDLTISFQRLQNMVALDPQTGNQVNLPFRTIIAPRVNRRPLFDLSEQNPHQRANWDYNAAVFPGNPNLTPAPVHFPPGVSTKRRAQTRAAYSLPFQTGSQFQCSQAFNGTGAPTPQQTHTGSDEFSVDFDMPVGTPVCAARAGVVAEVRQNLAGGGAIPAWRNPIRRGGNYVRIRHDDGICSYYAHLQHNGVVVNVGDNVAEGQHIANSGNTGYSRGPHLHFDVLMADGHGGKTTVPWRIRVVDFGQAIFPPGIYFFQEPRATVFHRNPTQQDLMDEEQRWRELLESPTQ